MSDDPTAYAATPEVSPDGARINTPTGWLVDANGNRFRLIRSPGKGMQIQINAFVDAITQNVVALQMQGGVCLQETSTTGWYAYGGTPGNWTQTPAPPSNGGTPIPPQPPVQGGIRVSNGRFIDDAGKDVHLHGPNLRFLNWPDNLNSIIHHPLANRDTCHPMLASLPGTNCVRFDAFESMPQYDAASPDKIIPHVDALVKQGIFVEIECHIYPTLLTGGDLDRVCAWYATLARHYRGNPKVIWGTQNEPHGSGLDHMIGRIYDTIRGEGNDNVILICAEGGWSWANMNPANYQRFRNVAFDYHYYGWIPDYSMDPATNDRVLRNTFDSVQHFRSADGAIPMVVGEFSPCGYQNTNAIFVENAFWMDPNGLLVIDSVYRATYLSGWMQWLWNTPETSQTNGIGHLIKPAGNYNGSQLTDHGGVQLRDALRKYAA